MISQSVVTLVWHSIALLTFTSKFSCLQCMTSWQPIEEPGCYRNIFTAWGELVVLVPKVEVCYCYMTSNEARQITMGFVSMVMSITCQVRCLPDLSCWKTWTCRQNKIGTQWLLSFNFYTQGVERPSTDSKCSCWSANGDFHSTCQSVVQAYSRVLVFHAKPIDNLKTWVYYRSYAGAHMIYGYICPY